MWEFALSRMIVIFPAFVVVGLVELIRSRAPDRQRAFERIVTLAIGMMLAMGVYFGLASITWQWSMGITDRVCNHPIIVDAIGPSACFQALNYWRLAIAPGSWIIVGLGLVSGLMLFWPGRGISLRSGGWLLAVLVILVMALVPIITGGRPSLWMLAILVPIAYIPMTWRVPWHGRWGWIQIGFVLAGLALAAWVYLFRYQSLFVETSRPEPLIGQMLLFMLLPLTAGLLAARVVGEVVNPSGASLVQRTGMALLAILMLAFLTYVAFNETVWDNVMDGSSGMVISALLTTGAVVGAMWLAWTLTGARKLAALIFGILMVALVNLPAALVDYPNSLVISTKRGERIGQAVEDYQARTGRYPARLEELVPGDLLYVAPPIAFRELGWCYQSGVNFYRLGYVFRPVMGVPPEFLEVRTVRWAGSPPDGNWECEEELARQKEEASRRYMGP